MKFTEAQLESAIIELLEAEGYPHVLGKALGERSSSCVSSTKDGAGAPSLPGVLIKADLRAFLAKQYAADAITPQEIDAVIKKLEGYSAADLYESNKAFRPFEIVVPSQAIVAAYTETAGAIYNKIADGVLASQSLTKLRDTLLPKLISGELSAPGQAALS